jgi:hypothetical protein
MKCHEKYFGKPLSYMRMFSLFGTKNIFSTMENLPSLGNALLGKCHKCHKPCHMSSKLGKEL